MLLWAMALLAPRVRRNAECRLGIRRQQGAVLRKWRGDAKIFRMWRMWRIWRGGLSRRNAVTVNGRKSVQTVSAALL